MRENCLSIRWRTLFMTMASIFALYPENGMRPEACGNLY